MGDRWVVDVSDPDFDGLWAFCPLSKEGGVVLGLTFIGDLPPGPLVGMFHQDGEQAIEAFCDEHAEAVETLFAAASPRTERRSDDG